jgi:hypothetical protein
MGKLRGRMLEDLRLRCCAPKTVEAYVACARAFVAYHRKPPAEMAEPEIRAFFLHLEARKLSASTVHVYVSALEFLYGVTLQMPEVAAKIFGPRRWEQRLLDTLTKVETEPPRRSSISVAILAASAPSSGSPESCTRGPGSCSLVQGVVLPAVLSDPGGLAFPGDRRALGHRNGLPDGRCTTRAATPRCPAGRREAPVSP